MRSLGGLATKKLLSVARLIENDTKCSSHVNSLSTAVVLKVLASIGTTVAVNVFKLVLNIWDSWVKWVMVVRLADLPDPWSNCHKLLGSFILFFEHWIFLELLFVVRNVVFAIHDGITLFLVVNATLLLGFTRECRIVSKTAYCSS